jgi:hypothetical protein
MIGIPLDKTFCLNSECLNKCCVRHQNKVEQIKSIIPKDTPLFISWCDFKDTEVCPDFDIEE